MSEAYNKFLNKHKKKPKPQHKLISIEDSFNTSQHSEHDNVFLDNGYGSVQEENKTMQRKTQPMKKEPSRIQTRTHLREIEVVDDDDLQQGEQHKQQQLSCTEKIALWLGHLPKLNEYPMVRQIGIVVNDDDIKRQTQENQSYIAHAPTNQLSVSFLLFLLVLLGGCLHIEYLFWLIGLIVSVLLYHLYEPQYAVNWEIIVGLFVSVVIVEFVCRWVGLAGRRTAIQGNSHSYRTYQYQNHLAQWENKEGSKLVPGSIYKVGDGEHIPADSLLLHCEQALIRVTHHHLLSKLTPQPATTLKQTLIHSEVIALPLTGVLRVHHAQHKQLQGKLILSEPMQVVHSFTMDNVLVRGSRNVSGHELLCVVMETGIDSMLLSTVKYPYLSREEGILNSAIKWVGIWCTIGYVLMVGLAVLTGYIYMQGVDKGMLEEFRSSWNIDMVRILLYHVTNYLFMMPILLRVMIMLYSILMTVLVEREGSTEGQKKIKIKDVEGVQKLSSINTVISTIDTLQKDKVIQLQSIRVKSILHSFQTRAIDDELYSTQDTDYMNYFLSVALLTLSSSPYDEGLQRRCSQLNIRLTHNQHNPQQIIINGGQFRVFLYLSIQASPQYPYSIKLYKLTQGEDNDSKILCLVRGEVAIVMEKFSSLHEDLLSHSKRLHEEKGYHVEVLCKRTLHFSEAKDIKHAYSSPDITQQKFFDTLSRYFVGMDVLGLLVWDNQYTRMEQMPVKHIIIAPPSQAIKNGEFQAIHSVTNMLMNSFQVSLLKMGDLILHHYPSKQEVLTLLAEQKVVVLNGWDSSMIEELLQDTRQQLNIMAYMRSDEYAWIYKYTDLGVSPVNSGYDLGRYSDMEVKGEWWQVIMGYGKMIQVGILGILIVQVRKCLITMVCEFIHCFYSWGTGISLLSSPLYLLTEICLLFDVLYFLRFAKSKYHQPTTQVGWKLMLGELAICTMVGCFISLLSIYSMQGSATSTGAIQSAHFTSIVVHFILLHSLILCKLFLPPYSISLYKVFIILLQVVLYYIGMVVISATDTYYLKGIIWFCFQGRIMLTAVFACLIIFLTQWVILVFWLLWKTNNFKSSTHEEENVKLIQTSSNKKKQ